MTNREKYQEELLEIAPYGIALVNGVPTECLGLRCSDCDLFSYYSTSCTEGRLAWLDSESPRFKVGDIVKHFKRETYTGSNRNYYLYEIVGFAKHTETGEKLVIYKSLYTSDDKHCELGKLYARPYDMFNSLVDKEKYPDIKQKYRFEPVSR